MVVKEFKYQEHVFRPSDTSKILGNKIVSANRWESESKRIQKV